MEVAGALTLSFLSSSARALRLDDIIAEIDAVLRVQEEWDATAAEPGFVEHEVVVLLLGHVLDQVADLFEDRLAHALHLLEELALATLGKLLFLALETARFRCDILCLFLLLRA